jgi:Ca2+-binding EF-hand superfamily protein
MIEAHRTGLYFSDLIGQERVIAMLSDLRARKMAAFFHAADENKDGVIEYSDYEKLIENLANLRRWQPGSPEYSKLYDAYMFMWQPLQALKLTLPEYLQILGSMIDTPEARDLNRAITRTMFDLMDTDGDNQIGLTEYAEYLAAHRFDEAWAANAFKQLDTDGDGIITRDQYSQISADFFFSDDESAPGNWLWGSY